MLAVGNAHSKTCSIKKENLCVVYLSVDLSVNRSLVGGEYGRNKYEPRRKNKKEGYFLMRNLFRGGG